MHDFTHITASKFGNMQAMTSQFRSHIEYLTETYYVLLLIF